MDCFLTHFPQDEQDAFGAACARYGHASGEFEVAAEDRGCERGASAAGSRQVTVMMPDKATVARYDAGHGVSWTVEFERDLGAGSFD